MSKLFKNSCRPLLKRLCPSGTGLCADVTLAAQPIHLLPTFFAEPGTFWKHLATMISNLPTDLSFLAYYVIVPRQCQQIPGNSTLGCNIFLKPPESRFHLAKITLLTHLEKSLTVLDSYHLKICVIILSQEAMHKEQSEFYQILIW